MRRWRRSLLCLLVGFLVIPASPVAAHAALLGSDPADGSVLAEGPDFAQLRFSEEVLLEASNVTLLQLGSGDEQVLPLVAADGGLTLKAKLPKLPRGGYILRFVAIDPADLHKTVGSISFGLGVEAPPSQAGAQIDGSWWTVAIRAITDGLLLIGVGAVVVTWLAVRRKVAGIHKATRLAAVCLAAVSVGWVALFIADVVEVGWQHARWGRLLIGSDPGRRALIGVQLALGAWCATRLMRGAATAARAFIANVIVVIAAGFVLVAAYGGHAGVGGNFVVGIALRALHYGSLCVWLGTVGAAWLVGRRSPDVRTLWPDVSRLAALGLATTGITGLLLSGRVVVTVTALLSTTYGKAVVGKILLFLVLAAIGGLAARRVARGLAPLATPVELAVAAIALVLASLLASSAPARGERFTALPAVAPQVVTGDVRDLTVSASIQPARPGPNLVQVRVLDTRRPSPGPIESVVMRLTRGDGTVVAERDGVLDSGLLEWADVAVDSPGDYRVEVVVDRPTVAVPVFVSIWQVERTPVPRAKAVVSNRSWAPLAVGGAALWMVIVFAGRWLVRRRAQVSKR